MTVRGGVNNNAQAWSSEHTNETSPGQHMPRSENTCSMPSAIAWFAAMIALTRGSRSTGEAAHPYAPSRLVADSLVRSRKGAHPTHTVDTRTRLDVPASWDHVHYAR